MIGKNYNAIRYSTIQKLFFCILPVFDGVDVVVLSVGTSEKHIKDIKLVLAKFVQVDMNIFKSCFAQLIEYF